MRIFIFIVFLFSSSVWAESHQLYIDQSKPVIKKFAMALQGELKAAIASGGPVMGIEACHIEAPVITENSQDKGWKVSRTSLKWRNNNNRPDSWEEAQMNIFEEKLKNVADPKKLWAVYEDDKQVRVLKAIPTQPICLACHGSELSPDVQQKLNVLYPDDRATGFRLGDLRGAFSLKRDK